jgi:sulfonate transport system permease protein
MLTTDSTAPTRLDDELAGLDALELAGEPAPSRATRLWSAAWPKFAAVGIGLFIWQLVVWSGWRPEYVLPGPGAVFSTLGDMISDGTMTDAVRITMERAVIGFALAVVIGVAVGALVSRVRLLRVAFGSLITGLQTMPSIAWFPLAILLFQLSEEAIRFVVVMGAAPAIANGLISGVDHIPPLMLRAGHVLGAKGIRLFRYVILPASMPSFVAGLKQGWAFSWRSLMAGELLVLLGRPSVGYLLQINRDLANAEGVIAVMIVILVIGILVDSLFFGTLDRALRRRWGLLEGQ